MAGQYCRWNYRHLLSTISMENTHVEVGFKKKLKATLLKSHFGMGVLLVEKLHYANENNDAANIYLFKVKNQNQETFKIKNLK